MILMQIYDFGLAEMHGCPTRWVTHRVHDVAELPSHIRVREHHACMAWHGMHACMRPLSRIVRVLM